MPEHAIRLALLMFNVGVEFGQVFFVGVVLAVIAILRHMRLQWPEWVRQLPAYGVGGLAAFWVVERVSGF